MTEGQWFAVLWGPYAMIFGSVLVLAREPISRFFRAQRERRGIPLTPNAQSPARTAIGGIFSFVAGAAVLALGVTGIFR